MKYSLFSAGALALAGVVSAGGYASTTCGCSEVVVWETETVWVTVAPGYQTPTSCSVATAYPTSCSSCGHTVVGTLPQYIETEVCTTVTCNDGQVLPTSWTTGSTCWVNTWCSVDNDGKTYGLDPTTKTVTPCSFPTATLLPAGCEYETCVIPPWVIDVDGVPETIPGCTVTWTWYPGPSYYPEPYQYTTTSWNKGTPVISIINNISINIVTQTGSVWVGGKGHGGSGGPPAPTSTSGHHGNGNGYQPPAGGPPSGPPAPAPAGGSLGGNQDNTGFIILTSDDKVGIVVGGKLIFVDANSALVSALGGLLLNDGTLTDINGDPALPAGDISAGLSEILFQPTFSRKLFRRAGNGTANANNSNNTLTFDFNPAGELEGFYGNETLYFFDCAGLCEVSLSSTAGNCTAVTLTSEPLSSIVQGSGNSSTPAPAGNSTAGGLGSSPSTTGSSSSSSGTTAGADAATGGTTSTTSSSTSTTSTTSSSTSTSSSSSSSSSSNTGTPTTTGGSSTAAPVLVSGTPADFAAQMVQWHNTYRARHGSPAVIWNDTLAAYAANYSRLCSTDHSDSPIYGENLAYGGFTNPGYYVYLWYNEIQNYDFNNPGFSDSTGHFTQVVWEASLQIGCGWVYDGCTSELGNSYPNYLACEYWPYGNVDGEFAEEVPNVLADAGPIVVPPQEAQIGPGTTQE